MRPPGGVHRCPDRQRSRWSRNRFSRHPTRERREPGGLQSRRGAAGNRRQTPSTALSGWSMRSRDPPDMSVMDDGPRSINVF